MRRALAIAAAALLALGLATAALLIWAITTPGLLNTTRITTDPTDVAAIAAADLGLAALPAGVTAIGARQDGFQDRIVWIRLDATETGLDTLLAELDISRDMLRLAPSRGMDFAFETFEDADWWRFPVAAGIAGGTELRSQTLAHLTLTVVKNATIPDLWHLYLQGHEI